MLSYVLTNPVSLQFVEKAVTVEDQTMASYPWWLSLVWMGEGMDGRMDPSMDGVWM